MTKNDFEFIPVTECELCDGTEFHPIKGTSWRGTAFSYALCQRCGLKFMDPRPTPASLTRFFTEEYWQANMTATGFPTVKGYDNKSVDQMELRMPKYRGAYARVRNHLTSLRKLDAQTRFLEVGCAFGYTLEWLHRDHGCRVFGVEPSTEATERCRQAPAIDIIGATAEEVFVNDVESQSTFDVILFRHTLETLLTPRLVLAGVRRRLHPDGMLAIYTPNVEFHDLMSPFTPFVYSPETITRLLRMSGFAPVRVLAPPSPIDKRAALHVAPNYEIAVFAKRAEAQQVEHPNVDAHSIMETIAWGAAARTWSQLTARDLLELLAQKVRRRAAGRLLGRDGKRDSM